MSQGEQGTAEYARFRQLRERALDMADMSLANLLRGRVVAVVGGTGCIGSGLIDQVARYGAARIVSLSRGANQGWDHTDGVEMRRVDIRDAQALGEAVTLLRPDIVFHVAAQRDPGRAEKDVYESTSTNVLGTENVVHACLSAGVPRLVYASTGKALQPYSPQVYASTKRIGEWLVAQAHDQGRLHCSIVRFTHVVDNSLVAGYLHRPRADGYVRIHDPDIRFYAQSRLEAAQLLALAAVSERRDRRAPMYAIRNLGMPIGLLDLALGSLQAVSSDAAIYLSGYQPGYGDAPYPGLYDPETAVDVSPLFSAFEAHAVVEADWQNVDRYAVPWTEAARPLAALGALRRACECRATDAQLRDGLDRLTGSILDASLDEVPRDVLRRVTKLAAAHEASFTRHDRRLHKRIQSLIGVRGERVDVVASSGDTDDVNGRQHRDGLS
jgi:dTDP-4-dehydrorhamnose reductase